MQDNSKKIPTPRQAAIAVASLYVHGRTPTPEQELEVRRDLATANLYKAAREMLADSRGLDEVGCAHVIGYILGVSGVKYEAVTVIERIVRESVAQAQGDGGQE